MRAATIIGEPRISRWDLHEADCLAQECVLEFEILYYRRDPDLLHHVRPCIHVFSHAPREIRHTGPLVGHTQSVMERTIGNLGEEIKLPSNPYANFS